MSKNTNRKHFDYEDDSYDQRRDHGAEIQERRRSKRMRNALRSKHYEDLFDLDEDF